MEEMRSVVITVLICFEVFLLAGRTPVKFDRLSVENGLSENAIICIIQDSRGVMWIGTHDGLSQYDGYRFTVHNHDPADSRSISNNIVQSLYEDGRGTLWVGTSYGLNRWDPGKGGFVRYFHNAADPGGLSGNRVGSVLEDRDETLWVGTHHGGLSIYDRANDRFGPYPHFPGDERGHGSDSITALFEDGARRLWVGTNGGGIFILDKRNRTCDRLPLLGKTSQPAPVFVQTIYQTDDGMVWVGTLHRGLFRIDPSNRGVRRFTSKVNDPLGLGINFVPSVIEDMEGGLWVGTYGGGLHRLREDGNGFDRFCHDPRDPRSLSQDRVTDMCIDRTGILWVGTEGGGLNIYCPLRNQFEHLRHDPLDSNSLSGDFVHPIFEDRDGVVWIGTTGSGLTRYNPRTGRFDRYRHRPEKAESLAHDNVQAICQDRSGNLWVATDRGLSRCRPSGVGGLRFRNYHRHPDDGDGLGGANVLSLHWGAGGTLWVGTDMTLDRYDPAGERFEHFSYAPPGRGGDRSVHAIFEDLNGRVWIGTWGNGLFRFETETGEFKSFRYDHRQGNGINHNVITSFWQGEAGVLWIGTYGGGLNRLDLERMTFSHYTQRDGLPNNVVYGMVQDGAGRLWLSTNGGLSCFSPESESFFNYDAQDGLQSNEFNRSAYCRTRDGRLWFGGINGINVFHPEQLRRNTTPPPIMITSFKVFNREVPMDWARAEKEGIVLSYRLNFFSFEFAALDYTAPAKNRYAYRLVGVDDSWVESGERRYAAYTNLRPGRYVFRVKGSNDAGVWNEAGVSIPIHISPAFWQTAWFRLLLGMALLVVLTLIVLFTVRHIRLLKAKSREESFAAMGRFASYFAHDLKSPVEGAYLIASEMGGMFPEEDERRRYLDDVVGGLKRIRGLVGEALDFSKAQNPRRIPTDLNAVIGQAVEDFRGHDGCRFDLDLDESLPPISLDGGLIRRLFVNLFENSFQASRESCVISVKSRLKKEGLVVEVADNGRGIDPDILPKIFQPFASDKDRGYGFGLAFVHETVKSHGGSIDVQSLPGAGARFEITFPPDSGGTEES